MTRIPREAVISAMRRLRIQRVLITTITLGFWKDRVMKSGTVEFTNFPLIERWEMWTATCMRI